jgi:cytochrome P450
VKDTTLPRGGGSDGLSPVFVPKDTEVNYGVYAMHRNTDFWGLDAEKFIPERWDRRKTGFEYLPFNGGPR